MVPESAPWTTVMEHVYRYHFASQYVVGRRVLDIACGEGYGAAALKRAGAAGVIGVDIDPECCAHAAARYGITAKVGNAEAIPLPDGSVDVVVSFETIEHLENPERFLDESARVLTPDGTLVISTPNGAGREQKNPFHVHEMEEAEFTQAVQSRWHDVTLYGQGSPIPRPLRRLLFPGVRTQLRRLRRGPDNVEANSVARPDPVAMIQNLRVSPWALFTDPYAIHARSEFRWAIPDFLIAVARGPMISAGRSYNER